ncbi:MAG: CAP domain-containing protein [Bacteroidales bacterium]|nr:CAP domain-containing protein [Bacteroidales bacterium]
MKNTTRLTILVITIALCLPVKAQELLKDEAKAASEFLNQVRQDPDAFSDETGVDLSYVEAKPELSWNSKLAGAAEKKALDMATRNYFGHTDPDGYGMNYRIFHAGYKIPEDWFEDVASNYFESIQAGHSTGKRAIIDLIIDEGVDPPGHRNHLLGIEDFWSNCTDIGIGMAKKEGSTYTYYMCVMVAKHDF